MTRTPFGWWFYIAGAVTREDSKARLREALDAGLDPRDLSAIQLEHMTFPRDPLAPRAVIRMGDPPTPDRSPTS